MRRGTLLAVKFDPSRLEVSGTPVPIVEGIAESVYGAGQYTVSAAGTLAYIPGKAQTNDHVLSWVDASGRAQPLPLQPRTYWAPKVSPDGRTIALSILGPTTDVWTYDIAREALTRLSVEAVKSPQVHFAYPVWTPDGKRIVYGQPKDGGAPNLFWRNADGSGAEERLTTSDDLQIANCWLPDGQTLLFTEFRFGPTTPGALLDGNADLMTLRVDGDRKPQPFQQTPFDEWGAACSPDGRWIAYLSNESGRMEVYVRPFRGSGEKWKISNGSGMEPVWSRDGKQLFFRGGVNQELMMAVPIGTTPTFTAGKPARLFQGNYYWDPNANFDVAPDGRFLMMPTPDSGGRQEIRIVQNWFEELRRRVP